MVIGSGNEHTKNPLGPMRIIFVRHGSIGIKLHVKPKWSPAHSTHIIKYISPTEMYYVFRHFPVFKMFLRSAQKRRATFQSMLVYR